MKTQGVCQFCDVERCGSCIIALDTNSLLERERARSLDQLLSDAEIEAETAAQGISAIGNTPEEFARVIRADMDKWAKVLRSTQRKGD